LQKNKKINQKLSQNITLVSVMQHTVYFKNKYTKKLLLFDEPFAPFFSWVLVMFGGGFAELVLFCIKILVVQTWLSKQRGFTDRQEAEIDYFESKLRNFKEINYWFLMHILKLYVHELCSQYFFTFSDLFYKCKILKSKKKYT